MAEVVSLSPRVLRAVYRSALIGSKTVAALFSPGELPEKWPWAPHVTGYDRMRSPGEPSSEPHFRVARQRLGATTACRHEQEEEPSRNTRKHLATGHATCLIITRPWHHGPLSMVDLGRVDATILIGDGVRLQPLPDSKLPAANNPYRRGFPRGRGLLFPRPPSGGPAPEGFFLARLRSVRGSIRDWVGCPCRPQFASRRDVDAVPSSSHLRFDYAPVR